MMNEQIHSGFAAASLEKPAHMDKLWHINGKGLYWSGQWGDRTPEELYFECETTMQDLLKNHPNLDLVEVAKLRKKAGLK